MTESREELTARLNLETGRIGWTELQRHFARGEVLVAARELDLLEVAAALVRDDKTAVVGWKDRGVLHAARDEDALRWQARNQDFWAVVVAPWVVAQEARD